MSMTEEIKKIFLDCVSAALVECNVEKTLSYISDDIIGIGIWEQGLVSSKEDVVKIITPKEDMLGIKREVEIGNLIIRIHSDTAASVCARITVKSFIDGEIKKSSILQSMTFRFEDKKWKICLMHASADMVSEESIDAYPINFAEKILPQLKEHIQAELLHVMNRNLSGGIIGGYCEKNYPLYFVNDTFLKLLGYTRDEFETKFKSDTMGIIYPDDMEEVASFLDSTKDSIDLNKNGTDLSKRYRLLRKDGTPVWTEARMRKISAAKGKKLIFGIFIDVSELIGLKQELEERTKALTISEERFRIALEKTSNIIFDYDLISGNIMHSSAPKKSMDFITNIKEAQKELIIGGVISEDSMPEFEQAFSRVENGDHQAECVVRVILATGRKIWNKISMTSVMDSTGKSVRAIGMIEDITDQKETELALARGEQYRSAILSDSFATYIINITKGVFENYQTSEGVPYRTGDSYDEYVQKYSSEVLSLEFQRQYIDKFSRKNLINANDRGVKDINLDYICEKSDGTSCWQRLSLRMFLDIDTKDLKGFCYVTDIDEKKREEISLKNKSERDPLTMLYNKTASEEKIKALLSDKEFVVGGVFMIIDLDRFKQINDNYGHPFGDKVLVDTARGFMRCFRDTDIVGRIGGDEFCVFLYGIRSQKNIHEIAKRLCEISRNIPFPDKNFSPSCSIGISISDGDKDFKELYKEADEALYRVKNSGRNGYEIYDFHISEL